MQQVIAIFFTVSMLVMSATLLRGVVISRRAVQWRAARVKAATERTMDRHYDALDDATH